MPAVDQCEAQMIRAFEKAGWMVAKRPLPLILPLLKRRSLYADLLLQNTVTNDQMIIIEVKCFSSGETLLDQFYSAVGQVMLYREAFALYAEPQPVFLAIPASIYNTEFSQKLYQRVFQAANIARVIVDIDEERVIRWIP